MIPTTRDKKTFSCRLSFFILLLLIGFSLKTYSQTLYLNPFGGVKSILCSYDKEIGKVSTFKVNYLNTGSDFGFLLRSKLKNLRIH